MQDPFAPTNVIATKGNTSSRYVSEIRQRLRAEGLIPPLPPNYKLGQSITNAKYQTDHSALQNECEAAGIPTNSVSHYWYKGKHFSIFSKTKEVNYNDLINEVTAKMQKYSPKYKPVQYKNLS